MAKPTLADRSRLAQYCINPQLIVRRIADSTLVCLAAPGSLNEGAEPTKLDAAATTMLDLLRTPRDVDSLTLATAQEYGIGVAVVRADVEAALTIFVEHQWVYCP